MELNEDYFVYCFPFSSETSLLWKNLVGKKKGTTCGGGVMPVLVVGKMGELWFGFCDGRKRWAELKKKENKFIDGFGTYNGTNESFELRLLLNERFGTLTQQSAVKFGIPRLVFSGMGIFSTTQCQIMGNDRPHAEAVSPDSPFLIPDFPKLMLTRNDFDPPFGKIGPTGEWVDFVEEQILAKVKSHSLIVNSFYELESSYVDYWNHKMGPKAGCVGPLCLAKSTSMAAMEKPLYMQWLDDKSACRNPRTVSKHQK
ncbi:UDP-glycosyltransferase 90A1-like [Olea europaea var. sylvestris]|uniref:UDP-glycosyltransferase 90A1-like n=1 Tax=Olea europaea var. sylvestris TaxID=158386 RepID=UPI000C1CD243|nr:UDP-glycosyltransferase 90A1-like [Olea europaea var. sylvestris]